MNSLLRIGKNLISWFISSFAMALLITVIVITTVLARKDFKKYDNNPSERAKSLTKVNNHIYILMVVGYSLECYVLYYIISTVLLTV